MTTRLEYAVQFQTNSGAWVLHGLWRTLELAEVEAERRNRRESTIRFRVVQRSVSEWAPVSASVGLGES